MSAPSSTAVHMHVSCDDTRKSFTRDLVGRSSRSLCSDSAVRTPTHARQHRHARRKHQSSENPAVPPGDRCAVPARERSVKNNNDTRHCNARTRHGWVASVLIGGVRTASWFGLPTRSTHTRPPQARNEKIRRPPPSSQQQRSTHTNTNALRSSHAAASATQIDDVNSSTSSHLFAAAVSA